jgi:hypothetical protein
LGDPDRLDRRVADWIFQPHIDEIQAEHSEECVEEGMNNLGGLGAAPHRRKSEDANQVIITTPKALDLVGGKFFHLRPP